MVQNASTVLTVERMRKAYKYKFTLAQDKLKVTIVGGSATGDYPVNVDRSKTSARYFISNVPLPQGSDEPIARRVEVNLPPEWFPS